MKSTPPTFSIIIASYNYGHLISRAITSVLSQDNEDYELIVIDDGSTDETEKIVPVQYQGRLTYIRKENGGQSSAYNSGIQLSKGEYIYILDADDSLEPGTLSAFHKAINDDQRKHLIYFAGYISVERSGKYSLRAAKTPPQSDKERLRQYLLGKTTGLQHGSTIMHHSLFSRLQYPEQLRNNTDIVLFGQALSLTPAKSLDFIAARIFSHPGRVRNQIEKTLKTGTLSVEQLFDPNIISPELMRLKPIFLARRLRSLARSLYKNQRYAEARDHYFRAICAYFPICLDVTTLLRLSLCILRSHGKNDRRIQKN